MSSSPNGKTVSRMNAFKHGLRATDELFLAHLKFDERQTFENFRGSLFDAYNPQTDLEKLLVDRIVIQHFRLFRLYGLEYDAVNDSTQDPLGRKSVIGHLDRFSRYDTRIERQLRILHNRLVALYFNRHDDSLRSFTLNE